MKPPSAASRKRVTQDNLAGLGAQALARILLSVAEARPEVKRRLRMELAAEQGGDHLALEIDKRLVTLEGSRGKVSWRNRPTYVRELETLRDLAGRRLAELDTAAALDRLWRFMALARGLEKRVRDADGELAAVFIRAAADIAALLSDGEPTARALVAAIAENPIRWQDWLPVILPAAPPALAGAALRQISQAQAGGSGWATIIRQLADAAGDIEAYRSTFTSMALLAPAIAADIAARLLAAGRTEEAGKTLEASRAAYAKSRPGSGPGDPDYAWESVWIDYLEQSGWPQDAQQVRWASFERTLSAERARAFTRRLADFDDVEAEARAFEHAAGHADADRALAFLIDWPALPEAARLIEARADALTFSGGQVDLWAERLRQRYPAAAHTLLRRAATVAFRRRDFATSDRLTHEADALAVD